MLSTLFLSALTLASKGVASVEDIDRSWMGVMRTPIGPFGIMDQVGLTTVWTITEYWAHKTGDEQAKANADFLKKYVDQGALGFKTMKGFYSYPNPAYASTYICLRERRKRRDESSGDEMAWDMGRFALRRGHSFGNVFWLPFTTSDKE